MIVANILVLTVMVAIALIASVSIGQWLQQPLLSLALAFTCGFLISKRSSYERLIWFNLRFFGKILGRTMSIWLHFFGAVGGLTIVTVFFILILSQGFSSEAYFDLAGVGLMFPLMLTQIFFLKALWNGEAAQ